MWWGSWVFLMSTGLEVVAESPDALCPTLAEVEAAIDARVGEVVGGSYTVSYTIVRDPENQRELIRMTVTDHTGAFVLERSIPVGTGGCSEAAQAMAVILERHFQSLEAPREPEAALPLAGQPSEPEPPPSTGAAPHETADQARNQASEAAPPTPDHDERDHKRVSLRAGFGVREAPQGIAQIGAELRVVPALALSLDAVFSLGDETATELGHEFVSEQFGLEFSASWLAPLGPTFALGIGPLLGIRMEVARLDDDAITTGTQDRFLPHLGLQGLGRVRLGPTWHLDLTARGARVLTGPATGFEIETAEGDSIEVLEPREWMGEAIFSLGVRL